MPSSSYGLVSGNTATNTKRVVRFGNISTTGFDVITENLSGTAADGAHSVVVHATNAVLPQAFTEQQIQTVVDAATQGAVPTYSPTQTTTSGTSVTFTDVPSWARKITVMLQGVSHDNGSSGSFMVQLGTDSGVIETGYLSTSSNHSGASVGSLTDAFGFTNVTSSQQLSGQMFITKLDSSTYVMTGQSRVSTTGLREGSGELTGVTGTITRVHVKFTAGNFDSGKIRLLYE